MTVSWIPPRWLDRNPRDALHVAAALRMIVELTARGSYVTERTMAELRQAGVRLNIPGMRVGTPKHADVVIGGFFFLDEGLLFPDNTLLVCDHCRAPLQIRPHANRKSRKLCCFCAVDEVLASHWASVKGP